MRLVYCVIVAVVLATVNAAAMPVGCGGSPSPGTGASMTTTPSSLSFSSSGSGTSSQSMSLDPSGWIVDRFQVSGSQSWVTATVPSQGGTTTGVCDAQGNCGAISVSVDSTGLSAGTHTAAVLINPQYLDSCEGNQSFNQYVNDLQAPMSVQVTLNVTAAATIGLSKTTLTFNATQGDTSTPSQTVMLSNSGGGTMNWTTTVTSGGAWLGVSPSGAANNSQTLTFTANPTGLTAGQYTGNVRVDATGATNTPQNVGVTLNVAAAPAISIGANTASVSLAPGGASQGVTLTLNRTNYTGSVTLATSTLPTGVTATITQPGAGNSGSISLSAAANAPVVSNQTITVTASGTGVSNATTTFSLTVSAAPAISIGANPASVSLAPGGASQGVTLTLNRTNYTGSVTLATSTLPTGVTATFTQPGTSNSGSISLSAAANAAAVSNQTITVTASGSGVSNATATFSVTVTAVSPAAILVSAPSLQFSAKQGSSPQNQTLQLTSSGSSTIGWTAAASTADGHAWLSVSPATGTTPASLTVAVSSSSLADGAYSGNIAIAGVPGTNVSPVNVPVSLAIGVPTFAASQVVNAASLVVAAVSPGSLVSLSGTSLSAGESLAQILPLPTTLAGTQVLVGASPGAVAAPLFYVSPTRIYFQMPYGLSGGQIPVTVKSSGVSSAAINISIAPEMPGIFTLLSNGGSAAVLNQNGSLNSATNPAARGSTISIYATGLGATNPPLATGQLGASAEPYNRTVTTPQVTIGGVVATVSGSFVAPHFAALYQVNVVVPSNAPSGSAVAVQITVNGNPSNIATIAVN